MSHLMRNMLHTKTKRFLYVTLGASLAATTACYYGYTEPRMKKYEEFYAKYDPYKRMREICETGRGYLHTCPQELVKLYEEKGLPVESRPGEGKIVAAAEESDFVVVEGDSVAEAL
uniref:COX6C domain-containing protein n=1 Tax=Strongyloides stercoralis TaxID=6248 RepID=A0A0K0EPM2_STRER